MTHAHDHARTIWENPAARHEGRIADGADVVPAVQTSPALTRNPIPIGWRSPVSPKAASDGSARIAAAAESPPRSLKVRPALTPTGLRRYWRYFAGLITMLRSAQVVRDYPLHLQLEVTNACNLHCTTCSRDVLVRKASLLDEVDWKAIIDQMKPTNINVSGIGEPFLHPRIFEIIGYAKSKGAAINCATNFTRVNGRHRELVECGINRILSVIRYCSYTEYYL